MIPYPQIASFQLGPLIIHPFGALAAVALLTGVGYAYRVAERDFGGGKLLLDMAPWFLIPGFLLAHLTSIVFYFPSAIHDSDFWNLVNVTSGLSSFGGLLGGALGAFLFVNRNGFPVLPWLDVLSRGFSLSYVFGRAGCTIAHDHPGLPADFILAMDYPARDGFPAGPRHDLGFYGFLLWLLIFLIFVYLGRKRRADGTYLGWMIVGYAPIRFGLDFLRINDPTYSGLTFAQWCCLFVFPIGMWILLRVYRRPVVSYPVVRIRTVVRADCDKQAVKKRGAR